MLAALQSPQPPPIESILTTLLNEITTIPDNFILVLDDYHVIDSEPVDQALTFLLEHLPPQMHLVIATREDPSLPLARLRARGQLTELRAADLRFTPAEAAEFLNQMMGLNLSAEDIAALETRTEGWIAGLQLAALSMQGRADIASFIQAFTGSHRFVLDYLVEEVLQHQPEHIRSFLLQTAILDRFCAPLCNAVTEREDGREMLDVLERSNLFLVPLDDKRQWYRYHHLFAEVLQAHLMEEQPDQVIYACISGQARGIEQNGLPIRCHPPCAGRRRLRARSRPDRTGMASDGAGQYAVHHVAWLGEGAARGIDPCPACAQRWRMPGHYWMLARWRPPKPDCGTPNGGWKRRYSMKPHRGNPSDRRWSSWTKNNFGRYRHRLPPSGPTMPRPFGDCPVP